MKALKEVQEVCVLCHIYSKRVYAIVGGASRGEPVYLYCSERRDNGEVMFFAVDRLCGEVDDCEREEEPVMRGVYQQ